MTEDDLLTRLPDAGYPASTRPLPSIIERAHEIRRGSRLYALGGATTVVAGLTAISLWTGISLPGNGSDTASNVSVAGRTGQDAGQDCSSGRADTAPRNTVPDLLFLPSTASAGPIAGEVFARRATSNCAYTKPEGIAFTMKDAVVSRRLEISGPDARNQYDFSSQPATGSFAGTITDVTAGGGTAKLYLLAGTDRIYMFWTAPDRTTWSIQSDGQTPDELIATLDSLRFDHGQLETGTVPAGFDGWAGLPDAPYTARDRHEYRYVWVPLHGGDDSPGWQFEVSDRPSFADAPIGGRTVMIGAATGWWTGTGNKGQGQLIWRVGGAELRLSGNSAALSEAKALQIARSVTPVDVDDARLDAAWEN